MTDYFVTLSQLVRFSIYIDRTKVNVEINNRGITGKSQDH